MFVSKIYKKRFNNWNATLIIVDKRFLRRIDKIGLPDYELNSSASSMFYTSIEDYNIQEEL